MICHKNGRTLGNSSLSECCRTDWVAIVLGPKEQDKRTDRRQLVSHFMDARWETSMFSKLMLGYRKISPGGRGRKRPMYDCHRAARVIGRGTTKQRPVVKKMVDRLEFHDHMPKKSARRIPSSGGRLAQDNPEVSSECERFKKRCATHWKALRLTDGYGMEGACAIKSSRGEKEVGKRASGVSAGWKTL